MQRKNKTTIDLQLRRRGETVGRRVKPTLGGGAPEVEGPEAEKDQMRRARPTLYYDLKHLRMKPINLQQFHMLTPFTPTSRSVVLRS